jgi:methionyl-tRNA synthetase
MKQKDTFYITTTLPYINAPLHIGHALEFIQADVIARYHRAKGERVFFLTGTDEHGSKIANTAETQGLTPRQLANQHSKEARGLKKILNLSWDYFIRTTDKKNHWPGVKKVWKGLEKSGDLYKKTYRGLYCTGCEAFVGDRDLEDGKCSIHKKEPELVEEENYFFRLSAYSKQLKQKIESGTMRIVPEWREKEILSLIEGGLEDVSFSRPTSKLTWGIPVPGDDTQTIYVWADALTNYISAIGYGHDQKEFEQWWPANVQVLGKDVLRFHAAIWPAMLLALGLEVPSQLFVHGFITVEGQKMSKSIGNVLYPKDLVDRYGIDPVRYYFLRELSPFEDGDFSNDRFVQRYNGDLANGVGNFVARVLSLAKKHGHIHTDYSVMELATENKIKNTKEELDNAMREFRFHDTLASLWALISYGDGYMNDKKPWESTKTDAQKEKTLFNLLIIVNAVAVLLQPFLPDTAQAISKALSFKEDHVEIGNLPPLFPRL